MSSIAKSVCFCLLFGLLTTPLRAKTEDERFLEGLRKRRLFQLAETFCLRALLEAGLRGLLTGGQQAGQANTQGDA